MVTGQSVVLYSRLHLLTTEAKVLRPVKYMIAFDAFIFHLPITVMLFASHIGSTRSQFAHVYRVYEKVQMTGFCIQEFTISGIYLMEAVQLLTYLARPKTRQILWQLFSINIIIIALDILLLALEYRNLSVLEQTTKGLIYSIKLKLEFAILGKLVDLVQSRESVAHTAFDTALTHPSDFQDFTQQKSDLHKSSTTTETRGTKASVELVENTAVTQSSFEAKDNVRLTALREELEQGRNVSRSIRDDDSIHVERTESQEYADFLRQLSRP